MNILKLIKYYIFRNFRYMIQDINRKVFIYFLKETNGLFPDQLEKKEIDVVSFNEFYEPYEDESTLLKKHIIHTQKIIEKMEWNAMCNIM